MAHKRWEHEKQDNVIVKARLLPGNCPSTIRVVIQMFDARYEVSIFNVFGEIRKGWLKGSWKNLNTAKKHALNAAQNLEWLRKYDFSDPTIDLQHLAQLQYHESCRWSLNAKLVREFVNGPKPLYVPEGEWHKMQYFAVLKHGTSKVIACGESVVQLILSIRDIPLIDQQGKVTITNRVGKVVF